MIEDYTPCTYHYGGGRVVNAPPHQEGVLLYLKDPNGKEVRIFLEKRNVCHLAGLIKAGRRYWKRFRLPKMIRQ